MPRHKQAKKKKGATPPRRLLAMRKQRRRLAQRLVSALNRATAFEAYHGATVPTYRLNDPRHREVRDLVREHHSMKRVKVKVA